MHHAVLLADEERPPNVSFALRIPGLPLCWALLEYQEPTGWRLVDIRTVIYMPFTEAAIDNTLEVGSGEPLPLVPPLLAAPLLASPSLPQVTRRLVTATLHHFLRAERGLHATEHRLLLQVLPTVPAAAWLALAQSSGRVADTLLWLALEREDMSLFSTLLPCRAGVRGRRLTEVACCQRNLPALALLQQHGCFEHDDYVRHVNDDLTVAHITSARTHRTRFRSEVLIDLVEQGRFDLVERCQDLVDEWPSLVLELLCKGHWLPEVAQLMQRRRPYQLSGSGLTAFALSRLLRQPLAPLPDDWGRWVSLAPDLLHLAVLLVAGQTGETTTLRQLIAETQLRFLPVEELAGLLPYFDPVAAALPELEERVARATFSAAWFVTSTNMPIVKHYLTRLKSCHLWTPTPAPADAALVAATVPQVSCTAYLSDVSLGPTLDLPSMQVVIQAHLRQSGGRLYAWDRWLWRASLRLLLPPELRRSAQHLLRRILVGQRHFLVQGDQALTQLRRFLDWPQ